MPRRTETIGGYVQAMHADWLGRKARQLYGTTDTGNFQLEIRYRRHNTLSTTMDYFRNRAY
ncbi:hypothetical protein LPU83_pLPU83d_1485 (plasmid) [Rhizobium favelukesii]|uniref:Uncharacterized protein n=1 Tax=Rhizobium favelukesii TaxID=348824 RepID=W6RRT5_9HYPH|nr:hypothetical protein LPU83_pLPU83d_1485 [Rhizobium favelukesii]